MSFPRFSRVPGEKVGKDTEKNIWSGNPKTSFLTNNIANNFVVKAESLISLDLYFLVCEMKNLDQEIA